MPKKIENNDIFASDFLSKPSENLKQFIELVKLLESSLTDVLKLQKKALSGSDKSNIEGLKTRKKAIDDINAVSKEMERLQKQRITTEAQLKKAESEEAIALERSRAALKEKRKAVRDEIKAERELVGGYEAQSRKLNQMRKDYKELIAIEGKQTAKTREMLKDINKLNDKLVKIDKSVGQFGRNVGNYPKLFGQAKTALSQFGVTLGAVFVFKNIFNTVKQFNQSIANLSAITGATGKSLDFLKEKAVEMGSKTTLSASQVAEGFKLIASAKPELLSNTKALSSVTEESIKLAEAAGTDLPESAKALTTSLNQYGKGAEFAAKYVDILAAGAKYGAGDINYLSEGMKKAGTVAASSNVPFVKAAASLEVLAEKGIDASTAGTNFRNILLGMQKAGIGFVNGQFDLNAALEQSNKLLKDIKDPAERADAAMKIFGKENLASAQALLQNTDRLEELTKQMDENGVAAEQQRKNTNTLEGSLKAIASAWEGLVLKFSEGTGVFSVIKDSFFFIAANLETIAKVITVAGAAFVSYKATVMASSVAMKVYEAVTKGFAIVQALFTGGLKKATAAMRLFNTTVKLNPIGILITILTAAVTAFALFGKAAGQAAIQQDAFNRGIEKGKKVAEEYNGTINDTIAETNRLIDLEVKRGEISSAEATQKKLEAIKKEQQALKEQIELTKQVAKEEGIAAIKRKNALEKQIKASQTTGGILAGTVDPTKQILQQKQLGEIIAQGSEKYAERMEFVKNLEIQLEELGKQEQELSAVEIQAATQASDAQKKAAAQRLKDLKAMKERLEDLRNEAIKDEFKRREAQIKTQFRREIEAIKGNSETEIALRAELKKKETRLLLDLEREYRDKQAKIAYDATQTIGQIEKEQVNEQINLVSESLDSELALQLDNIKKQPDAVDLDKLQKLLNEKYDLLVREAEDERDLLLLNSELTAEERELIEEKYRIKIDEINRHRVKDAKDANSQIKKAQEQAAKDAKANADKIEAEEKATLQRRAQAFQQFTQQIINLMNKRTDKQLSNIDKELQASKDRQNQLEALAAQGNLKANQSVSAEIKRQAELDRQKEELQKKKARRQAFLDGLNLMNNKINNGEKDAVTSTIRDMSLLLTALTQLPGFYEGTDTTIEAALGKPHIKGAKKDGYLVRVDGAEKVLNPEKSRRTGDMTTEEITRAAEMYRSGAFNYEMLIHPKTEALNVPYQSNDQLLQKMDSLEQTIKDKPILSSLDWDELSKALIVTVEQRGDLRRTHYKTD